MGLRMEVFLLISALLQIATPVTSVPPAQRTTCGPKEFSCKDGRQCVPLRQVCSGVSDCNDSSDEADCNLPSTPLCFDGEFQCGNGRCIRVGWTCDGSDDCGDSSDEDHCSTNDTNYGLAIGGAIFGFVVLVVIATLVALACYGRRKNRAAQQELNNSVKSPKGAA